MSFHVDKSEIIGIVGESGSGKSVTSLSVMGLLAYSGKVTEGEILFKGEDLLKKNKREMRKIQGNQISIPIKRWGRRKRTRGRWRCSGW